MAHKTPILFIAHGSPMNAIEQNQYTLSWQEIGRSLEKPRAILMFSAHWITEYETRISTNDHPDMIYDMGGFPPELYQVRYDAPGSREIAEEMLSVIANQSSCHAEEGSICSTENNEASADSSLYSEGQKQEQDFSGSSRVLGIHSKGQVQPKIILDPTRGYDHGVWSVLLHMFPSHDIPVICMSLDYHISPREYIELGNSIAKLREKGILIMGSGNLVHNLRAIDWNNGPAYPWAIEFDNRITKGLESGKNSPLWESILEFQNWGDISRSAHPSHDHLLPLFPLMGASSSDDRVEFFTPDITMGSLSMRSVVWR